MKKKVILKFSCIHYLLLSRWLTYLVLAFWLAMTVDQIARHQKFLLSINLSGHVFLSDNRYFISLIIPYAQILVALSLCFPGSRIQGHFSSIIFLLTFWILMFTGNFFNLIGDIIPFGFISFLSATSVTIMEGIIIFSSLIVIALEIKTKKR